VKASFAPARAAFRASAAGVTVTPSSAGSGATSPITTPPVSASFADFSNGGSSAYAAFASTNGTGVMARPSLTNRLPSLNSPAPGTNAEYSISVRLSRKASNLSSCSRLTSLRKSPVLTAATFAPVRFSSAIASARRWTPPSAGLLQPHGRMNPCSLPLMTTIGPWGRLAAAEPFSSCVATNAHRARRATATAGLSAVSIPDQTYLSRRA
jgi:hypothetical protein